MADEEVLCYAQGRLVREFWNAWFERFPHEQPKPRRRRAA